jgi:hypothetical protein
MQTQNRVTSFRQNNPVKRAVPLFGADPSNEFEDWANFRTPKLKGPGTGTQPLQTELKEYDSDVDKWKGPNPNLPSLLSHGKRLNYDDSTDQRPIKAFQGEIGDIWDGQIQNTPKKDFQSVRTSREPIIANVYARDIRKNGYDFY